MGVTHTIFIRLLFAYNSLRVHVAFNSEEVLHMIYTDSMYKSGGMHGEMKAADDARWFIRCVCVCVCVSVGIDVPYRQIFRRDVQHLLRQPMKRHPPTHAAKMSRDWETPGGQTFVRVVQRQLEKRRGVRRSAVENGEAVVRRRRRHRRGRCGGGDGGGGGGGAVFSGGCGCGGGVEAPRVTPRVQPPQPNQTRLSNSPGST